MSAIFGVLYLDGRAIERESVQRMSDRLAHRGPDGSGVWMEASVGLGHRALYTTPESVFERQPLVHHGQRRILTADARVDNRDELMAALGLRRPASEQPTDAELILAAYDRWGEECPERIIGDFAFAIWDHDRRSIFCARDVMGVKPFYYHLSDRLFAFASEVKALLTLPEVPCRLNELQVAYYIDAFLKDREITFYEGIVRLPAGHSLCIGRGARRRPVRYWDMDTSSEICLGSDAEYAEAFRERFDEAVRCRLRSPDPVGSALSGGLDSSSIACTARHLLADSGRAPLHTFSAVFPGLPEPEHRAADESQFIAAVTSGGGFVAHHVRADELSPLHDLPRLLWHLDEAPMAYNLYMHAALYDCAQQHGVRVFLDGIDGDSCVGHGLQRLDELVRSGSWGEFDAEVQALCTTFAELQLRPGSLVKRHALPVLEEFARAREWSKWLATARAVSGRLGLPMHTLALRYGVQPLTPDPLVRAWRQARRPQAPPRRSLLDHEFVKRVQLDERRASLQPPAAQQPISHQQWHWEGLDSPEFQYALAIADLTAAAHRVEPRYPFFDRRLMEFCVALPMKQKLSHGWTRAILRRAMEGILPPEVQWRPSKQDLSPPFRRGLQGADRAVVERELTQQPHPLAGYLDVQTVSSECARFLSGDSSSHPDGSQALYRASVLSYWLGSAAGAHCGWSRPAVPTSWASAG